MSYYQEFLENHPEAEIGSTHWNIFCASNRLVSLEWLKKSIDDKNTPSAIIDASNHHYSTKQVAKTYERLHEKYFGKPPRERWYGEANREKFNKLRKFLNENELELESHIAMNMQCLVNYCTYKGMPFRVSMLSTIKSLTRSLSKMKDNVRSVGNAHYEGADVIFDDIYASEYLLAENFFGGVEGDDPDMHRISLRNISSLSEYFIANTPRIFEYVLNHDVIKYESLEILDSISEKMSKGKFKTFVEEKHYEARIAAAYSLCEDLCPGSSSKILIKKRLNMLTPKFWNTIRDGFRTVIVSNSMGSMKPANIEKVDTNLGMSLYG